MPSSRDSYGGDDKKKKRSSHNPKNSKSSPHRASKIAHHIDNDDDSVADFSVAPGMDSDVKSVVSVNFDHVYQRGRKVSVFFHRVVVLFLAFCLVSLTLSNFLILIHL